MRERAAMRLGRVRSRLATVRQLSPGDRWLLLQAALLLPLLRCSLRVFSVHRIYAGLRRLTPAEGRSPVPEAGSDSARVDAIARLVDMASRHTPVTTTCLHRSLALWWLLSRRGLECRLRLGARRQDGRFEAHAWVEHRGAIVNDDPASGHDYVALPWLPMDRGA